MRQVTSSSDDGWKQILEQEILHLQEHVESVNRDLVACAMALRESLSTHDDANNLILLLSQTRERRRHTHHNVHVFLKQQEDQLKVASNEMSHDVDDFLNVIMEHYSDQMETMEIGDNDVQTLVDQVVYGNGELNLQAPPQPSSVFDERENKKINHSFST